MKDERIYCTIKLYCKSDINYDFLTVLSVLFSFNYLDLLFVKKSNM